MTRRPKTDLDSLALPKDGNDARAAAASLEALTPKAYAHTLSVRMTADQYRRLRRHLAGVEDRTGGRVTQQALFEAALDEYLTARNA